MAIASKYPVVTIESLEEFVLNSVINVGKVTFIAVSISTPQKLIMPLQLLLGIDVMLSLVPIAFALLSLVKTATLRV